MTVASTVNKTQANGNGSTSAFPFSFKFTAANEIEVYVDDTLKTITTHYTLTDPGASGTVTFLTAPTDHRPQSGEVVTIRRIQPLTQTYDPTQGGGISSSGVEASDDNLLMKIQQIDEQSDRAPRLKATTETGQLTFPEPLANGLISYNAAGTDLETKIAADVDLATVTPFIETLLDDATAAEARTTLGALGGAVGIVDGTVPRADGTGGVTLQSSGVLISDTNHISGASSIALSGANGVDVNPGSDADADLITVNVTGSPTFSWDESSDAFKANKPLVISSDGNGDITHTIAGAAVTSDLEVHSDGTADLGGIAIHRHTDLNDFGGHLLFLRSDGTHAAPSLVDNGDTLARIVGLGYDGTDYELGGEVRIVVDGVAANNQMPTGLDFYTNAGSQALTRRVRMRANGSVEIVAGPLVPSANDGAALGTTALGWADLHLASGAVINYANSNYTITHSSGLLTFSGGITATAGTVTLGTVAGAIDAGGATSLEIPNDAAPSVNANGEIAIDTSVTDFSHGIIKYFGGEEMAVIAVPVAELTTPSDGDVVAYNATNDEFELVPQSGGSAAWTYAAEAATTSGTAVTIASGLPTTVREIEIMLRGVSQNSADADLVLRLGDAGGFEDTGYTSIVSTAAGTSDTATTGFYLINAASFDAATTIDSVVRLICYNDDNTQWHMTSVTSQGSTIFDGLGRKDLSAAITQLQLTTLEGTPTFDAGTVSVRYR